METLSRTWKIELRAFGSTTLTDEEFLSGRREGRPVTLTSALRLPPGTGKVPAVVLMHGSGGLSGCLAYDATAFAASKRIVTDFIRQVLSN